MEWWCMQRCDMIVSQEFSDVMVVHAALRHDCESGKGCMCCGGLCCPCGSAYCALCGRCLFLFTSIIGQYGP